MIEDRVLQIAQWVDGFHDWAIYLAIAAISFFENLFPPFPGDVLTIVSAIYVRQGRIEFIPAYLWSVVGGTVGYFLQFLIFRSMVGILDRPFIKRFFPTSEVHRVTLLFDRYGGWLIAVNRFFTGIRSVIAFVAGMVRYPKLSFLLLAALSCAIFNYMLFMLGWAIGGSVHSIQAMLSKSRHLLEVFGFVPFILTLVVVISLFIYFVRLHRNKKGS